MEVANIIVHDNDTGIISIDSFGVMDIESKDEVVEEAEQFFLDKCVEIKFGEGTNETREDLNERNFYRDDLFDSGCLDDGYIEINGITVSFVWSYIENIQL